MMRQELLGNNRNRRLAKNRIIVLLCYYITIDFLWEVLSNYMEIGVTLLITRLRYILYHVQSSRFMVVNHRNELPWYRERNRDGIR